MRQLNGRYTQQFNHRHSLSWHLFQGRYKAILIQKESHLLELSRYVVLNPVRANMVDFHGDWKWSSYHHYVESDDPPEWFNTDWLLSQFAENRIQVWREFASSVLQGKGLNSPLLATRHQLILGDDRFVERHKLNLTEEKLREVPDLGLSTKEQLAKSMLGFMYKIWYTFFVGIVCYRSYSMPHSFVSTEFACVNERSHHT